jgi:hypothetical protein
VERQRHALSTGAAGRGKRMPRARPRWALRRRACASYHPIPTATPLPVISARMTGCLRSSKHRPRDRIPRDTVLILGSVSSPHHPLVSLVRRPGTLGRFCGARSKQGKAAGSAAYQKIRKRPTWLRQDSSRAAFGGGRAPSQHGDASQPAKRPVCFRSVHRGPGGGDERHGLRHERRVRRLLSLWVVMKAATMIPSMATSPPSEGDRDAVGRRRTGPGLQASRLRWALNQSSLGDPRLSLDLLHGGR